VTKIEKLLTKEQLKSQGPSYILFSMDINPTSQDLMPDDEPLTVYDIMETGMRLATEHTVSFDSDELQYFDVYDVSKLKDTQIYQTNDDGSFKLDDSGNKQLDTTKIRENGTLLSADDYTLEDVTGQEVEGMDANDVGKPAYKITVPDGKRIIILYWASVEGSVGDEVEKNNQVHFFYNGTLRTNSGGTFEGSVKILEASSSLFTGPFMKLKKTNQSGEAVEGATFTMYKYVDGVNDEEYMTVVTGENGSAYIGHRANESGDPIKRDTLYYIVETAAPDGYRLDPTPYYFEFKTADESELTLEGYEVHQHIAGDTVTLVNTEIVSVSVSKIWDDVDDLDGVRPDSITINLLKNGEQVDSKTVTADDGWSCTFEDLDKYDEDGVEILYTVEEEAVEGYETSIASAISITATKLWEVEDADDADDADSAEVADGAEVTKPDSITINLLKNGEKVDSKTVTEAGNWSCTFEDLDMYDENGEEILYTVEEDGVEGYDPSIAVAMEEEVVVTNSHDVSQIADTGVHIDYLPYVLIFAIAGGLSILMVICRAKRRKRYL
jgi:hypothetical protein